MGGGLPLYSGVVGPGLLGLLGLLGLRWVDPLDPLDPLDPGTGSTLFRPWLLSLGP